MGIERFQMGSKRFKGNGAKLVNFNFVRCSSLDWFREDVAIPEWLLVEVLIRLPVKFIFRCKIVSKEWLSTISDLGFVRTYISRAPSLSNQQRWTLVTCTMFLNCHETFPDLEYELLDELCVKPNLFVLPVPCIQELEDRRRIYGVSNGLVLYGSRTTLKLDCNGKYIVRSRYYICNPLTRQCIALPLFDSYANTYGWGFLTHVEDGFLKSYRVVIKMPYWRVADIFFKVYISEIGEWKEFIVSNTIEIPENPTEAATLNGILHWLAPEHGIIAYDPYQKPDSIRIIATNRQMKNYNNCLFVAYQGKLRFIEASIVSISGIIYPYLKVWVLNDYDSGDWCLQHFIRYSDVQYGSNCPSQISTFAAICFHPFDSDIVYLGCDDVCVSYNMKTRKLQVEEDFFRYSGFMSDKMGNRWWSASLLVVPPWPISIPNPYLGAMEIGGLVSVVSLVNLL